jgi:hypothetical protein
MIQKTFDCIGNVLRPSGAEHPSAHILAMLCGCPRKIRLAKSLVMLVAFFDESVSSIGTQDYVIAGYVQTAEVWSDFSDEWAQVLDAAPIVPRKMDHQDPFFAVWRLVRSDRRSSRHYFWFVGNPSVTRPNGQRRVRCGLPVIRPQPGNLESLHEAQ